MGKKPFSGKKKKKQLQEKKAVKALRAEVSARTGEAIYGGRRAVVREAERVLGDDAPSLTSSGELLQRGGRAGAPPQVVDLLQRGGRAGAPPVVLQLDSKRKLRTVFGRETRAEIERRVMQARAPLTRRTAEHDETAESLRPFLDFPKRPPWNHGMTKEELDASETAAFREWLADVYGRWPRTRLNYFEHNLEVWRQLWRVVEMSDVLLVVTDARYPLLHFPASLYEWVAVDLNLPFVLVLNKVDLVSEAHCAAWERYFRERFPRVRVVRFSTFPQAETVTDELSSGGGVGIAARRRWRDRRRDYGHAFGVGTLASVLEELGLEKAGQNLDFTPVLQQRGRASSHGRFVLADADPATGRAAAPGAVAASSTPTTSPPDGGPNLRHGAGDAVFDDADDFDDDDDLDSGSDVDSDERRTLQTDGSAMSTDDVETAGDEVRRETRASNFVTIGLVGQPNVGKSTVLNALVSRKVVSCSITPGHTKHFQTIFLTPRIRLCDCPGLVFPGVDIPKALQVVYGLYPLAQLQEPYTAVQYLAERLDLVSLLGLRDTDRAEDEDAWSAWLICEAYARRRGFLSGKAGRVDTHRAAIAILKSAICGQKIVLMTAAPGASGDVAAAADAAAPAVAVDHYDDDGEDDEDDGEDDDEDGEQDEDDEDEDDEEDAAMSFGGGFAALLSDVEVE